MAKKNKKPGQQAPRRGSAAAVDVAIGDKRTRAFLATIENDGRDHLGRVVGTNGIKWAVA